MKLIQLNIWQGKILIAVSRFLKEQDADIVCLQEVFSSNTPHQFPLLDILNSLEKLQKVLNYSYIYFEPTCTFEVSGGETSFGNAILSKFPVEKKSVIFTNGEFYNIKDWASQYIPNSRNALICSIQTPSGSITLANHHGYWTPNALGDETSVES